MTALSRLLAPSHPSAPGHQRSRHVRTGTPPDRRHIRAIRAHQSPAAASPAAVSPDIPAWSARSAAWPSPVPTAVPADRRPHPRCRVRPMRRVDRQRLALALAGWSAHDGQTALAAGTLARLASGSSGPSATPGESPNGAKEDTRFRRISRFMVTDLTASTDDGDRQSIREAIACHPVRAGLLAYVVTALLMSAVSGLVQGAGTLVGVAMLVMVFVLPLAAGFLVAVAGGRWHEATGPSGRGADVAQGASRRSGIEQGLVFFGLLWLILMVAGGLMMLAFMYALGN